MRDGHAGTDVGEQRSVPRIHPDIPPDIDAAAICVLAAVDHDVRHHAALPSLLEETRQIRREDLVLTEDLTDLEAQGAGRVLIVRLATASAAFSAVGRTRTSVALVDQAAETITTTHVAPAGGRVPG